MSTDARGYLVTLPRIQKLVSDRTEEPDFSGLPSQVFNWTRSVNGDGCEQVPKDAPLPRGRYVVTSTYLYANLFHDHINGRALTAVLHLVNDTPIDWYCKRQATVEAAPYGSEFVAARTAVNQIVDLRNTMRYLGVPIWEKSYMFGDNMSVTISCTVPASPSRNGTMHYPTIGYKKQSQLVSLPFTTSAVIRILQISLASIGPL
jgi:hypothetical protein